MMSDADRTLNAPKKQRGVPEFLSDAHGNILVYYVLQTDVVCPTY